MAAVVNVNNATFASPVADAAYKIVAEYPTIDKAVNAITGLTGWQWVITVLMGLVLYDQGKLNS
jgi:hypothetical protein